MTNTVSPNLTGEVAIVTGGGRGIGRAISVALASAGATVVVVDLDPTDTVVGIEASGGHAIAKTVDVTDQPAVDQMVHEVEQHFGAVDLLINNAGIGAASTGRLWEVDPQRWWRTVEVDLRGPFLCARAVLPGMIHRRQGRLINMTSGLAHADAAGVTDYGAAKAGLARLSGNLALETKEYGIAVFAIDPGTVHTHLFDDSIVAALKGPKILRDAAESLTAFFESGGGEPPELVAQLVVQLASGRADALSGRFIDVFDDLDDLIRRADEITQDDLYSLKRPTFKHDSTPS